MARFLVCVCVWNSLKSSLHTSLFQKISLEKLVENGCETLTVFFFLSLKILGNPGGQIQCNQCFSGNIVDG